MSTAKERKERKRQRAIEFQAQRELKPATVFIGTTKEEWGKALVRCILRHPRSVLKFENHLLDTEIERIMNEAR